MNLGGTLRLGGFERLRALRLLITGVVVAAVVGLAGGSSASAASWFGFNDNSVAAGQLTADQSSSLAKSVGASSSRVTLDWSWVQPTQSSQPNFNMFDWIYQSDLSHGIRPLFVLVGSPAWARDSSAVCPASGPCWFPPSPAHDADWQKIAGEIASRYPKLAGIEIWNEPNLAWAWDGGIDPTRYTELLKLAHSAIKSANPSMPVIGGALATDLDSAPTADAYPAQLFLQAMYRDGAAGQMDGLSLHPYATGVDPWYAFKAIGAITATRNAAGDPTPLWVTETGVSSTAAGMTAGSQALALANLVPQLVADPNIAAVYVHALVEDGSLASTDPTRGFGIANADGSPKPALCAVSIAEHGTYSCSSGAPQPTAAQAARWRAENMLQAAVEAALAWRRGATDYSNLTAAALAAIDPRISSSALAVTAPGATADPSRIGLWPSGADSILICNVSQADASFCVAIQPGGKFVYGAAVGNVYAAAGAVMSGQSTQWLSDPTVATTTTAPVTGPPAPVASTTGSTAAPVTATTPAAATTPATAPTATPKPVKARIASLPSTTPRPAATKKAARRTRTSKRWANKRARRARHSARVRRHAAR